MLGLESSVKWRGPTRFGNVACAGASLRPMPSGGRAATGSHRGHWDRPARPELGCTASGAEPMANCGAVRARHGHGGTRWWRGPRGSGLSRCGVPRHVAACSRSGRDRLVNRPDLAGQHAHLGRPDADLLCGRARPRTPPAVASSGRQPAPTVPGRPYRRRVRWNRDAAPAWPCPPARWVGRSLATRPRAVRPGERAGRRAGPGRSPSRPGR